jgi:hypothetical protein
VNTVQLPGFVGPSFPAQSAVWDSERSINFYPDIAPPSAGATPKSHGMLVPRPGLKLFAWTPNGPIRGIWAGDNTMYCVGGETVYSISSTGAATAVGNIPGSTGIGPVYFQQNGNQLMLVDYSVSAPSGAFPGKVFLVGSGTISSEFSGFDLEYFDSFYISLFNGGSSDPNYVGAGAFNQLNTSNSLDGTTWQALNYICKTGSSDLLWKTAVLGGNLFLFGQKTTEIWYDAAGQYFPFARVPGGVINIGLLSPFSMVKFVNTIIFLGCDALGYARVYMMQGTNPVPISTTGVEAFLNTFVLNGASDLAAYAVAYGYEEAGHVFWCLNMAGNVTYPYGWTLCYDLSTGLWHERTSIGAAGNAAFIPTCCASAPGLTGNTVANYVGGVYVTSGGFQSGGAIYLQSLAYASDNGVPIYRQRTFPHLADRNHWRAYPSLEISADAGTAEFALAYSNDGGRTYPLSRPAQGASNDQAQEGGFGRYRWLQLGRSRDRVFQVSCTDSVNLPNLIDAYVGVEQGIEP